MSQRYPFFDSLKFVLIFLVVFGHFIERFQFSHVVNAVYSIIYTFHMPLFIFISGYFSKKLTWKKYKKSFIPLLATYFVFQFIFSIPYIINNTFNITNFLFKPESIMWYLAGILGWRLCICFINNRRKYVYLFLIASFILSFIAGGYLSNSYQRFFYFLPYFILGYLCTDEIIQKIRNINKWYSCFIFTAISFVIFLFSNDLIIRNSLFGSLTYLQICKENIIFAVILRLLSYVVAILMAVCVTNLCPSSINKWGDKTLYIYLLHGVFIYNIYYYFSWNYQLFSPYSIVNIMMALALSIISISICIYSSELKIVKLVVDPYSQIRNYIKENRKNQYVQ